MWDGPGISAPGTSSLDVVEQFQKASPVRFSSPLWEGLDDRNKNVAQHLASLWAAISTQTVRRR